MYDLPYRYPYLYLWLSSSGNVPPRLPSSLRGVEQYFFLSLDFGLRVRVPFFLRRCDAVEPLSAPAAERVAPETGSRTLDLCSSLSDERTSALLVVGCSV
eukprot:gb/GECG01002791.1/.p2 GENE.gb/GECG01002791.1/~~gb/GECG01002791.1/.p2  ORF type:complete len:100 (-),score=6.88 gb/GECG01002791.1/:23-322(-)